LPRIAHYWTKEEMEELEELVSALPAARTTVEKVQGNSWHVRLEKRPRLA